MSSTTTDRRAAGDAAKALGNEEFNKKNYEKSIEYYTQAISHDSTNHVYYSNRSASYGALTNWAKAREDAQACIEIQPSFAKGYARLANALRHLGKLDEALAVLRKGKAVDDQSPDINALLRELKPKQQQQQPSASLPPSVQKELGELEPKYKSVLRELEGVKGKMSAYTREKKRIELTKGDLKELPTDTIIYKSVGKMFVKASDDINSHLENKITTLTSELSALDARESYLTRSKTSLEQNIRELVSSQ